MEGVHYSHLTIVRGEQDSRTVDSKAYYYEHVWSVLATHLAHKILRGRPAEPERGANGRQPLCPVCAGEPVAAASRGSRLALDRVK